MINYKILIYGAKSQTRIILNMIKYNEIFYENKKIKNKKVCLLIDPHIKKPEFKVGIPFLSKKKIL